MLAELSDMRTVGSNSTHQQRLAHGNGAESEFWEEHDADVAVEPARNGTSDTYAVRSSAKPFASQRFRQWWAGRGKGLNGIRGPQPVVEDWSDVEAQEQGTGQGAREVSPEDEGDGQSAGLARTEARDADRRAATVAERLEGVGIMHSDPEKSSDGNVRSFDVDEKGVSPATTSRAAVL